MNNLRGKRAILYRRVSTTDQRIHGNSLDAQRDSLRKFCLTNGVEIIKEFQEDHSAKDFENRPVFQELLRFVKLRKNEIDLLLVTQFDRFSRNLMLSLGKINELRECKIEVNAIHNWTNWDSPNHFIPNILNLSLPESDNRMRAYRTKEGLRQGLKEGRYNGKQPLGYMPGKDAASKVLMQPDPVKARLISALFKCFATGRFSQNQLLKDERFSLLKLTKSNLSRILSNEIYTGRITLPAFDEEVETTIIGQHESLVSMGTFQKVQEIRNHRKNQAPKAQKFNPELPLRGHLKCPKCSRNLTGSGSKSKSGTKHFYYHCNSRLGCDYRGRRQEHHKAFNTLLESIRPKDGVAQLFEAILRDEFNTRNNSAVSELKQAEKTLKTLQNKKDALLDKLLEGIVSNADYQTHISNLDGKMNEVNAHIDRLNGTDTGIEDFIPFGISLLTNLEAVFEKASVETKHQLLGSILAEKLELKAGKYRTPVFKEGFDLIFQSVSQLQVEKPKTGDRIAAISRLVPGAGLEPARP